MFNSIIHISSSVNLPIGLNHVGKYGLNSVEGTRSPPNVYLSWSPTVVVVCRLSLLLVLVLGPGDYSAPSTSVLPGPKVARIKRQKHTQIKVSLENGFLVLLDPYNSLLISFCPHFLKNK